MFEGVVCLVGWLWWLVVFVEGFVLWVIDRWSLLMMQVFVVGVWLFLRLLGRVLVLLLERWT